MRQAVTDADKKAQNRHAKTDNQLSISFHGETLTLLGDGTIYMPSHDLMIVSDLHLEKGAALSRGAPLPAFDTIDTLTRLMRRIDSLSPEKILCLGDSFHTVERAFLLPPDALAMLHIIGQKSQMIWVTGNHDSHLPDRLPGTACDEMAIAGIRLCHEAAPSDSEPSISGHFHPKARVKLRAGQLSARCFVHSDTHLIMPAFGSYTGGLNICDKALSPFVTDQTKIHLIHDQKLFSLPFHKNHFLSAY